jgi:hypothetical protein
MDAAVDFLELEDGTRLVPVVSEAAGDYTVVRRKRRHRA